MLNWLRTIDWMPILASASLLIAVLIIFPEPPLQQREAVGDSYEQATDIASPSATNERLADYTRGLEVFTAILAIVATFQGWVLLRAENTATIAAAAARKSADAAISTERARIFIRVDGENIAARIREIVEHGESGPAINLENPLRVEYRIINFGKTPALIDSTFAAIRVKPWPISEPEMAGLRWPPHQEFGRVHCWKHRSAPAEYRPACRHLRTRRSATSYR